MWRRCQKIKLGTELIDNHSHHGISFNSSTRAVILQSHRKPLLCKLSLHQDGSYSTEWTHRFPENKQWKQSFLTDTGDVILQDKNRRTCLFDQDMQLIDSWQYKGKLIACLPGPRTVYDIGRHIGHHVIGIRSQDGQILELKLEHSVRCYTYSRSVCEDVTTGKLVILVGEYDDDDTDDDEVYPTVDIYILSQDGKSHHMVMNLLSRIHR